jgi:hypothetical protein
MRSAPSYCLKYKGWGPFIRPFGASCDRCQIEESTFGHHGKQNTIPQSSLANYEKLSYGEIALGSALEWWTGLVYL